MLLVFEDECVWESVNELSPKDCTNRPPPNERTDARLDLNSVETYNVEHPGLCVFSFHTWRGWLDGISGYEEAASLYAGVYREGGV